MHDLDFHSSNNNTCALQLMSISYTNDGPRDEIKVFLNDTLLADVTTYAESKSGNNWNVIRTVLPSSSKVRMTDDHCTIRLRVVEADENGVEIDKCLLQLECSRALPDRNECPLDGTNADKLSGASYNTGDNSEGSSPSTGSDGTSDIDDKVNDNGKDNSIYLVLEIVIPISGVVVGVPGCVIAIRKCSKKQDRNSTQKKDVEHKQLWPNT